MHCTDQASTTLYFYFQRVVDFKRPKSRPQPEGLVFLTSTPHRNIPVKLLRMIAPCNLGIGPRLDILRWCALTAKLPQGLSLSTTLCSK